MADLIAISGPLAGKRYPLTDAAVEIGRANTSTISIPDSEAAWRHCVIRPEAGR